MAVRVSRLAHVCLGSTDLARTIEFYGRLGGFEVAHEFRNAAGDLYGVFLHAGDGTFLEFFNEQAPRPAGGLFRHLCFEVGDIAETAQRLTDLGFEVEVKRGRSDGALQVWITDPDGTMVEFHQYDESSAHARFLCARSGNP
jgi:catechol 2,3-dioxygenase-like lactoylglutathione lyase family enzyme